jgi:hypothetical protein
MAALCNEYGGINPVATSYRTPTGQAVLAELGLILGNTGSLLDLGSIGRFSEGIPARAFVGVTSLFLYGTAVLT